LEFWGVENGHFPRFRVLGKTAVLGGFGGSENGDFRVQKWAVLGSILAPNLARISPIFPRNLGPIFPRISRNFREIFDGKSSIKITSIFRGLGATGAYFFVFLGGVVKITPMVKITPPGGAEIPRNPVWSKLHRKIHFLVGPAGTPRGPPRTPRGRKHGFPGGFRALNLGGLKQPNFGGVAHGLVLGCFRGSKSWGVFFTKNEGANFCSFARIHIRRASNA
jgi:hypothetical protein